MPYFEHRQTVDAAAEGEALPLVGVEPHVGDHARMDHPAAEDLHPAFLSADDATALLHRPADVDLGRGLGEREVGGAHPQHDVVALEEGLEEGLERPFEVAEGDALVDHQPFDLVEHRRVGGVAVGSVHAAGSDHVERRAMALAGADLHRRGVRPEDARVLAGRSRLEVEGIHHRSRGWFSPHVERGEIVTLRLDLGPFGDAEAEVGKDLGELVHHLADRMDGALRRLRRRQRQVDRLRCELALQLGVFERALPRRDGVGHGLAQARGPWAPRPRASPGPSIPAT